ncbi:WYL domain-containing protein [Bacteroidia bacterium]|nr:WYL domain-containing protein [Bacteroidia bacterium]
MEQSLPWKRPGMEDLRRRLLIIAKVRNSQPVTHEELQIYLAKELSDRGIDDATLGRKSIKLDIRCIEWEFGIVIKYRLRTDEYYLENIKPNSSADRFLDTFDILVSLNALNKMPDFVFAEDYHPIGGRCFYLLVKAIEKSVCIHFSYFEDGEKAVTEHYVEPYAIREYDKRWYVIARKVGEKNMKTYALDNISALRMVDVWVEKDATVNLAEEYKYAYGMDLSGKTEELVLSFDKQDGIYLKIRPLNSTQEIIKDEPDEFIIQLRVRITDEFVRKLVMFPSLKVLRPAVLRQKVCDFCRNIVKQNTN